MKVYCGSICAYKEAWSLFTYTNYQSIENTCNSSCSTDIEDITVQKVQIYPNPAKDEIFIKSDLQIKKVEIYSLTGGLLLSDNNFNGKISVSALSEGIYLLKMYTDKGVAVSKIVKE